MKIKLLIGIKKLAEMPGGSERVLCCLASEFVQRGYDVTILTFDKPDGRPFYELDPRIKRIDLDVGNSSMPSKIREIIFRVFKLRKVIMSEAPDIAIGFNPSIFLLMGPALMFSGIPVVGSEHIVPDHFKNRKLQLLFYRIVAKTLTKITVLSENIRRRYPTSISKRMVPITNPVTHIPSFKKNINKSNKNVILNIGRLDAQKDQLTLILAFAQVAEFFPDWDLKIIGEGQGRANLELTVASMGLSSRISLPGVTKMIHEEYFNCDIFALSSVYESFGLVTIEAMQHKKPVIAFSDCPGTNEIITSGSDGLLVNPNNDRVEAFASGLKKLMIDSELRAKLGERAAHQIAKRFDLSEVFDVWESMLIEVCNNKLKKRHEI